MFGRDTPLPSAVVNGGATFICIRRLKKLNSVRMDIKFCFGLSKINAGFYVRSTECGVCCTFDAGICEQSTVCGVCCDFDKGCSNVSNPCIVLRPSVDFCTFPAVQFFWRFLNNNDNDLREQWLERSQRFLSVVITLTTLCSPSSLRPWQQLMSSTLRAQHGVRNTTYDVIGGHICCTSRREASTRLIIS